MPAELSRAELVVGHARGGALSFVLVVDVDEFVTCRASTLRYEATAPRSG
ncbi:hypothetical protein [Serinicoccus marinus]|nr:hypothetical protein [Serinicoccus marinus]